MKKDLIIFAVCALAIAAFGAGCHAVGKSDGIALQSIETAKANKAAGIAKADAIVSKARAGDLDRLVRSQNDALATLSTEAQRRQDLASVAIAAANRKAEAARAAAARILSLPAPTIGNECKAADELISNELGE